MTSKSLKDRMKGEPDLPPVASQWSAPTMEEMNSSKGMLCFRRNTSN